jgi:Peptidase family M41
MPDSNCCNAKQTRRRRAGTPVVAKLFRAAEPALGGIDALLLQPLCGTPDRVEFAVACRLTGVAGQRHFELRAAAWHTRARATRLLPDAPTARADRARCGAACDHQRRGQAPDGVSRGRPRDRRDAHRGSGSGAQRCRSSPGGQAVGVTFSAPDSDRFDHREPEVRAKIKVALGGRAQEEVVFGETSTGAESDIQQLTEFTRQMVGHWGMSETIGPVAVVPRDGATVPGAADPSSATRTLVDEEVCGSSRRRRAIFSRYWRRTAAGSMRWPARCSSTRRSTKPRPTPRPASRERLRRSPTRPPPERSSHPTTIGVAYGDARR